MSNRRMRLAILGATLLLVSCKHVRVARADYANNRITVCGGRWANVADLNEEASGACSRGVESTLSCGESVQGAVAQTNSYGTTFARPVMGTCCEYQCR